MTINSASYALPPVKRALRRLAIKLGVILGAIGAIAGFFYVKARLTPQHSVIVENGNQFPVEVAIAGEQRTIAAGQHTMIKAHDGALQATATGPGGFSESVSLELPDSGFTTVGRTALYNVGGASALALVTATYGPIAKPRSPVRVIDRATKLTLLPPGTWDSLDAAFPEEVRTKSGGMTITHVCHADIEHKQLGCPNA